MVSVIMTVQTFYLQVKSSLLTPHRFMLLFHLTVCSPSQIQGLSIDEAIAQLEFNDKKGAKIMKEVCSMCVSQMNVNQIPV